MKILMATDTYLPHPGGSKRVILETSRRLQQRGHQVTIMTFERDSRLPSEDEIAGVPVMRLPLRGKPSTYPRAFYHSWRAFQETAEGQTYNLLHIHLPLIGLGAVFANRGCQIPRVYTFHGPWHQEMSVELRAKPLRPLLHQMYGLYLDALCPCLRRWQEEVMRRCEQIVVLSEYSRQQVVDLFPRVRPDRLVRIPGGVDVERFRPAAEPSTVRLRLGLPLDRTVLLTVRRLVPRMGLENLLEAFASLSRERDDLFLVVGGRGRLEGSLRALADRLGIAGRVNFPGYIAEEDLAAYYQAADLFVLPTVALEGFGLITLEALACGLPVVATPVGAIPEILGELDARFLATGIDAVALAVAMHHSLEIVGQEGVELAGRCRSFAVEKHDWEHVVDRHESLYDRLLEAYCGQRDGSRDG